MTSHETAGNDEWNGSDISSAFHCFSWSNVHIVLVHSTEGIGGGGIAFVAKVGGASTVQL